MLRVFLLLFRGWDGGDISKELVIQTDSSVFRNLHKSHTNLTASPLAFQLGFVN